MPHIRNATSITLHVAAVVLLASCAPGGQPRLGAPGADRPSECLIGDRAATIGDTVTMALAEPTLPGDRAWPRSASERMVAAHLHETLVRVDCDGRVRPGLARSWRREDLRLWVLTLRDDAAFADGSPVTARDVQASWARHPAWALPATIRRTDDRTLTVELPLETDDAIAVLAHPALAPVRAGSSSGSVVGAGSHRTSGSVDAARLALTSRRPGSPVLRVRRTSPADARNQIDLGVDVLVTDDAAAIEYARGRGDRMVESLPWSHSYALLVPGRGVAGPSDEAEMLTALRDRMAADATRGSARAAAGPFWWQAAAHCQSVPGGAAQGLLGDATRPPRIVYDAGDRTARSIAERLVALAGFGEGTIERAMVYSAFPSLTGTTRLTAAGLSAADLERAIEAGSAMAFVVSLPQRTLAPCLELAAPGVTGIAVGATALEQRLLVPLIDIRPHLITRRGAFAGTIDLLGAVRLRGADGVLAGSRR
ncbi:MAG TPA: ABC transporter substrate-binding protein [Gemmatimonadaceae bacterium]|nr:ABC transporter substrate-binding protein [Gemmatimonadaceae bacterium]